MYTCYTVAGDPSAESMTQTPEVRKVAKTKLIYCRNRANLSTPYPSISLAVK